MEPNKSKLNQQQREEVTSQEKTEASNIREFATPEELLRFDAAQTTVPPGVEERLQDSLKKTERPASWWRRCFGI